MRENQGVSPMHQGIHTWNIVSHRIALSLVIVMLSCHPSRFFAGILNIFILVKFPHDLPAPIYLYEIEMILPQRSKGAFGGRSEPKPKSTLPAIHADPARAANRASGY